MFIFIVQDNQHNMTFQLYTGQNILLQFFGLFEQIKLIKNNEVHLPAKYNHILCWEKLSDDESVLSSCHMHPSIIIFPGCGDV